MIFSGVSQKLKQERRSGEYNMSEVNDTSKCKCGKERKFVAQWYWCKDWLNRWRKAYYIGPRADWMNLLDEKGAKNVSKQ